MVTTVTNTVRCIRTYMHALGILVAGAAGQEQFSYNPKIPTSTIRRKYHCSRAVWGTCPNTWYPRGRGGGAHSLQKRAAQCAKLGTPIRLADLFQRCAAGATGVPQVGTSHKGSITHQCLPFVQYVRSNPRDVQHTPKTRTMWPKMVLIRFALKHEFWAAEQAEPTARGRSRAVGCLFSDSSAQSR